MIVVSDTSPLNYLLLIGAIDVLPKLFGEVHVPPAVMEELQHPRTPEAVKRWAQSIPEWLSIRAPTIVMPASTRLDPGESDAIALALELRAPAILIDENRGRRVAKEQGLATLGTITVLELAAEQGLLDLKAALNSLEGTSFHVTSTLIEAALKRDAARRRAEHNRAKPAAPPAG